MKITTKHIAIFIATFALVFTSLPMEAHAVSTPPKVKTFNASTYSKTAVKLTWKKPGKASGYEIYVNGKSNVRLSIKSTQHYVLNLQPGTAYNVYIKTYNTYKQKQYYNSKTKKWQAKKPAKKYWKGRKTRKVNARKYSKASVVRTVYTKPSIVTPGDISGLAVSEKTKTSLTVKWNSASNCTGYIVYLNGTQKVEIGAGATSYTINQLNENTTYTIGVRGYRLKGLNGRDTTYGNTATTTGTTDKTQEPTPTPVNITPGNITGLTQVETTTSTIKIAWNKLNSNCTGYEVYINNQKKTDVGVNTTSYTFNNLTANTEYPIKVRAYYRNNDGTRTYGNYASIKITTDVPNNPGGDEIGGGSNPGDNPGTNTGSTFDYHNIPFAQGSAIIGDSSNQGSVDIGNGQKINKGVRKNLLPIVNAWMNENLPADATEAEKVNLCIKAVCELRNTPESIAVMGNPNGYYPDDPTGWKGNNECVRYADYFDTCAYAAGLISASRLCDRDEDYGIPWGRNHVNNFVWINGNGYIIDVHGQSAKATLTLINFDWVDLHAVPSNTRFDCRYY